MPWKREWLPTAVFLPGESHGQRSLVVYNPWGHKESDTTEPLTLTFTCKARGTFWAMHHEKQDAWDIVVEFIKEKTNWSQQPDTHISETWNFTAWRIFNLTQVTTCERYYIQNREISLCFLKSSPLWLHNVIRKLLLSCIFPLVKCLCKALYPLFFAVLVLS